jgi:hypothetical protein
MIIFDQILDFWSLSIMLFKAGSSNFESLVRFELFLNTLVELLLTPFHEPGKSWFFWSGTSKFT